MFDHSIIPRVYGLPPGVDFPKALVEGLLARHQNLPPEALARVTLVVNTRRMVRRIHDLFDTGPARLLPKIELLTDLGKRPETIHLPPAISPLKRRLELTQLVAALLERTPDLAPCSALYDLADSLASLMDEMQGEGVPAEAIKQLDISDQSGHWARTQQFLSIVQTFSKSNDKELDSETRQRRVIEELTTSWAQNPIDNPVILAGSTGSRGTTLELMHSVAHLPQGALVVPGFDFDMPTSGWQDLSNAFTSEDHPQYRFRKMMQRLNIHRNDIVLWHDTPAPSATRNKVVSLALRPAPVTDCWLSEGSKLTKVQEAFETVSLIEAATQRDEAVAIALRLRQAAETGETAALVTPDRILSRQVTAALDRWSILPDDSAGTPLHLTPPGRFLRHVTALFQDDTNSTTLLELLKHPLCHSAAKRNRHLLLTRDLELYLRRTGPAFPDRDSLLSWADKHSDPNARNWVLWINHWLLGQCVQGKQSLTNWVLAHLTLAERIATGANPENADFKSELWNYKAGRKARETIAELHQHSSLGGELSATDYSTLLRAILAQDAVRDPDTVHPHILIWGTLEARVQGTDLLILGGLNEGSWPEMPNPDPWLNRALRNQAGLLLPERKIGLAAHDFQQAIGAPKVWLTRSIRSDDAETVPSRWLNRLLNLLSGLPDQQGPETVSSLRQRGDYWLTLALHLDTAEPVPPAPRPAPCPPIHSRPKRLSVTEIKHLIRDPYAIYARHVLKLQRLDALDKTPDPRLRGTVVHKILEAFCRDVQTNAQHLTRDHLLNLTAKYLTLHVPWAAARALWQARMQQCADWFVTNEKRRLELAKPVDFEIKGHAELTQLDFTLTSKADRIDRTADGKVWIYDYKTGSPPSPSAQRYFDKQLLLEAAIAENAGFAALGPVSVEGALYLSLGSTPTEIPADLDKETPTQVWNAFANLIEQYRDPALGYAARRAMLSDKTISDYDQLARFGEWDVTTPATLQKLTS